MVAVLADMGGTNLRLAFADKPAEIKRYSIKDFLSFDETLRDFAPDVSALYLASAITPLSGIIEDKRFGEDVHWRIDLEQLKTGFSLSELVVLNDLEAAAYSLEDLQDSDVTALLKPRVPQVHFDHPPKLLVGIGTGIGHAFLFTKTETKPFVQRTHGGHIPAFGITAEQRELINLLQSRHALNRDLIMENIVSGHGLWTMQELIGKEEALKFFWEFLGLYCNTIVSLSGSYGGVYLTGGIMEDMVQDNTIDIPSFEKFFVRPMVDVVVESLRATPVHYCHELNLPIMGLSSYLKDRA